MKFKEFTVKIRENNMTTDVPPPSTAASVLQDNFNNNGEDSMHFKTPQPRKASQKSTVVKDRTTFYNELMQFHEKIGTPITRFPKLSGKEIDLHKLYSCMVARGGWMKVNLRDEWEEVLADMQIQESCVNITIAIKQIYIRFLDRYEKVYFLGESLDRADDEDDESEKMHVKRLSSRTLHSIPQTYNHHQHYLSESLRVQHKLPLIPRKQSEYDKLLLSLMSPLPNEQDFAINVCTLMSNEGRHMLKLDKCPRLLNTLMAHAGIFNSVNIREIFTEFYTNIRKHSLESFWKDCLADKQHFLELGYEDFFKSAEKDEECVNEVLVARDTLQLTDGTVPELELLAKKLKSSADFEQLDFLSLARGLGTHDYIGQRVHQIATILRNLSFIEENMGTLSRNRSFLRLLVMMSNVRWSNLHHMGLDMLGNVAPEIELADPTTDHLTRCLMSTVTDGLESPDRGVIINCLEILSKLLQKECNEDSIHKCLTQKIYNQICVFLCLNDIMLLLYTLECIYSLSSLGEKACTQLMHVRGIIDTLVSLVTVEAQSYGPDACILMRVVETIPSNMLHHHQQQKQQAVTQQLNIQNEPISSIPATITVQSAPEPPKIPVQGTGPPQIVTTTQPNATQNQIIQNIQTALMRPPVTTTTQPQPAINSAPNVTTPQRTVITQDTTHQPAPQQQPAPPNSMLSPNSVSAKHAQQQLIQENEQFAYAWLRATVEPAPTNIAQNRIEQQELYKLYMQASQKIGRRGVLSPIHFPRCVRTVFGGTVGPNQCRMEQNGMEIIQFYYEGVKLRPSPLPVVHKVLNATATSVTNDVVAANVTVTTSPSSKSSVTQVSQISSQTVAKTDVQIGQTQIIKVSSAPMLSQALSGSSMVLAQKSQAQQQQQQMQVKQVLVHQQNKPNSLLVAQLCGKNIILNKSTPSTSPLLQQVLQSTNPGEKNIIVVQQPSGNPSVSVSANSPASTSMHIRSLLANKVTTTNNSADQVVVTCNQVVASPNNNNNNNNNNNRNNLITTSNAASNQSNSNVVAAKAANTTCLIAPGNVNVHQVTQRQLQKQKDQLGIQNATVNNTSIVVNANNPNNPTNIKLGNSTISIKPGTLPNNTVITATNPHEQKTIDMRQLTSSNNPPPLAPLSQTVIKPLNQAEMDSTIIPAHIIKKGDKLIKIDPGDINSNNGSQKMTANKMLADLLEKKSDPPSFEVGVKRKVDGMTDGNEMQPPAKRQENGEMMPGDLIKTNGEEKPCKKAADLYAELAGSILEDEDMEEIPAQATPIKQEQKLVVAMPKPPGITSPVQNANPGAKQQVITVPVPIQRQLIMTPNNQGQVILSGGGATNQPPQLTQTQTTATIKTEQGYQTVPIILQHGQKQMVSNPGQNQTQYILATNQQGQTVMVPTQSTNAHPHGIHAQQTVLLTQAPQQHGTGTKTIIILQQPGGQMSAITTNQPTGQQQQGQKVIMTTPQGQQLLVTQMPRPGQTLGGNNIISTAQTQSGQKIFITRNAAGEIELQKQTTVANVGGQQVILASKDQGSGQFVLQQSPGGTQQLVNIVQTPQGLQAQRGQQIVIQTQAPAQQQPAPPQVQVTQTSVMPGTPNTHQIVIQKQGIGTPSGTATQQPQHHVPGPPQMQVQTKTVIVKQQSVPGQGPVVIEEKATETTNDHSGSEQIQVNGEVHHKQENSSDSTHFGMSGMENGSTSTSATNSACQSPTVPANSSNGAPSQTIQMIPAMDPAKCVEEDVDPSWLWICDWRGCPKKKFKSANEVYLHACAVHCPDNIEPNADIYCQWGPGPGLCDNLPRKRFSLMTHIFDRHCMPDSFRAAVKRRLTNSNSDTPKQPYPVTLIRQPSPVSNASEQEKGSSVGSGPGQIQNAGSAALQAIKRHTIDFPAAKELTSVLGSLLSAPSTILTSNPSSISPNNINVPANSSITTISSSLPSTTTQTASNTAVAGSVTPVTTTTTTNTTSSTNINSNNSNSSNNSSSSLGTNIGGGISFPRDDNEGPVTKSIRLTSALILRNLVNYSALAKRNLRHYEPHLAGVALSNVESSRTIAQVLYDMNETHPV